MSKIAATRKAKGFTQQALAAALNVTPMAVSNWEAGRRSPSLKTLQRIAAALGCEVAELV